MGGAILFVSITLETNTFGRQIKPHQLSLRTRRFFIKEKKSNLGSLRREEKDKQRMPCAFLVHPEDDPSRESGPQQQEG